MAGQVYVIRDWHAHFEVSQSKRAARLAWVAVPNKHDGKSFRRLMRKPNGPAVYGAWVLIVQVASKCPQRGVLADIDGPLSAEDISDKTMCPAEVIQQALDACCESSIGWIERQSWPLGADSEHDQPRSTAIDRGLPTGQYKTGHDNTNETDKDNPPPPPQQSAPLVPSQPVPRTPKKREGGEGGIEQARQEQAQDRIAEAETAVRTAGVNRFREAVQAAMANGMTVDGILAVVDTFHASPGKWGPPALHERLTKPGAADFAPHEGWVDPLPEWQGKQRRVAQGPKPPTSEEQAAAAADRAELERLEAAHGATLDGMTSAERLELLPADQAMVRRLLARDRGPPRGLARQTLLRLLDQRPNGSA